MCNANEISLTDFKSKLRRGEFVDAQLYFPSAYINNIYKKSG